MAVIRPVIYATASTIKTVLRDYSTGAERLWNTSGTPGFEAYNAANIANYGITTTEGSPGEYFWTVPPSLTSGSYDATSYKIAGANLATGDLASPVWDDQFGWTGTSITALPNIEVGSQGGLMRLGANVGNTTFTGASLGQPGMTIDGLQAINTNWGAFPLYFNDLQGTGAVGLFATGSAAVITLGAAGGNIFNLTPGANKDVFHATLTGTGLMFNPAITTVTRSVTVVPRTVTVTD